MATMNRYRAALRPGVVRKHVQALLEERSADAFLLSYPKAGRTWLRMMIGRAVVSHFDIADADVYDLSQLSDKAPVPRILVTHDDNPHRKPPERLNRSKRKYRGKKVVLLIRDPRDTIVSYYFQRTKRRQRPYAGDLSAFLHEREGGFDSLLEFYNIWAECRDVPAAFLLVRYEDLRSDPTGELRRVLDFLGLDVIEDSLLTEVVDALTFEKMRKMEQQDQLQKRSLRPGNKEDEESYKTRRGKVGGFRDYLSSDDIRLLNEKMERLSDIYGYSPS